MNKGELMSTSDFNNSRKIGAYLDSIRDSAKSAYALAYTLSKLVKEQKMTDKPRYLIAPSLTLTEVHGGFGTVSAPEEVILHSSALCPGNSLPAVIVTLTGLCECSPWLKELMYTTGELFKYITHAKKSSYLLQVRITIEKTYLKEDKISKVVVFLDDFSFKFIRHTNSITNKWMNEDVWGNPHIRIENRSCGQDTALVFPNKILTLGRTGSIFSCITDKFGIIPEEEQELIKFIDPKAKILVDRNPEGFKLISPNENKRKNFYEKH